MDMQPDDEDLEPFLSEVKDEMLPPRSRLGSLLYLEARETFLSPEQRQTLEAALGQICRALAAEASPDGIDPETAPREPPRPQGLLFPDGPEP